MKPILRSFLMFIRQITTDSMMLAVIIAPLLTALLFRFVIPAVENLLSEGLQKTAVLSEYYLLFDLILSTMTPFLFCFASSMVMLTEYDENLTGYLAVTPVGKRGYVLSRLLLPALFSFFGSFLLLSLFSLTPWRLGIQLVICFLASTLSIIISLLIFSFSHNSVEGMAMAKLSGLLLLSLPVPFFLLSKIQYLFSPLPSFWMAKFALEQKLYFLLPAILTAFLWIFLLYGRFEKKVQ